MRRELEDLDYLLPKRDQPRPLTYEQARVASKPRRCNVLWHRQGGALCCDLCASQGFSEQQVVCLSSDRPRVFRRR